jgi:hypothetical protein
MMSTMPYRRDVMLGTIAVCLAGLTGCGASTTLVTVHRATGSGAIQVEVENDSGVALNNLYLAKTEDVSRADPSHLEVGSSAEARVWGDDLLDRGALPEGSRIQIPIPSSGRWDVRALDRNGRYQHIHALKFGAGGRYLLKLGEDTWRVAPH